MYLFRNAIYHEVENILCTTAHSGQDCSFVPEIMRKFILLKLWRYSCGSSYTAAVLGRMWTSNRVHCTCWFLYVVFVSNAWGIKSTFCIVLIIPMTILISSLSHIFSFRYHTLYSTNSDFFCLELFPRLTLTFFQKQEVLFAVTIF